MASSRSHGVVDVTVSMNHWKPDNSHGGTGDGAIGMGAGEGETNCGSEKQIFRIYLSRTRGIKNHQCCAVSLKFKGSFSNTQYTSLGTNLPPFKFKKGFSDMAPRLQFCAVR